jgi:hypothetical protein
MGDCPADRTLAVVSHATDSLVPAYMECIPNPNYDVYDRTFVFTTCFRWSCLPAAYNGQPYVVTVPNMTDFNVNLMPAGIWHIRVSVKRCLNGIFVQA